MPEDKTPDANEAEPKASASFKNFDVYTVDTQYMKDLYDADNNVYYRDSGYETKPFLGIIIGLGGYNYFIPFTSAKTKHKKMPLASPTHFLIYEKLRTKQAKNSNEREIIKTEGNVPVRVLAMLDLRKMIPVPDGFYERLLLVTQDTNYHNLVRSELDFCNRNRDRILKRIQDIYNEQKSTGKVFEFYVDFSRAEAICDSYNAGNCTETNGEGDSD